MNVASYVNEAGEVVDFFEKGELSLFSRGGTSWNKAASFPLHISKDMSLSELKHQFLEAIAPIQDCEAFLIHELRGIFRVYLEEQGFHVWQTTGTLDERLNYVARKESEALAESLVQLVPSPTLVGSPEEAFYRINLIELLNNGTPHVSRDILLPFFETTPFSKLEVISLHTPKWFAMALPILDLRIDLEKEIPSGEGVTITVVPASGTRSQPTGKRSPLLACSCGG